MARLVLCRSKSYSSAPVDPVSSNLSDAARDVPQAVGDGVEGLDLRL